MATARVNKTMSAACRSVRTIDSAAGFYVDQYRRLISVENDRIIVAESDAYVSAALWPWSDWIGYAHACHVVYEVRRYD